MPNHCHWHSDGPWVRAELASAASVPDALDGRRSRDFHSTRRPKLGHGRSRGEPAECVTVSGRSGVKRQMRHLGRNLIGSGAL